MPLGEVYPALTRGVIDGVETQFQCCKAKLYEQARYLTMVNYLTNTSVWIGGEAFFSTLSPEQLEMIHQTGYEAGVYSQKLTLERDAEMLKTMQAAGVEVIYPDTGPFQKHAKFTLNSRNGHESVRNHSTSNCNGINAQRPASSLLGRTH